MTSGFRFRLEPVRRLRASREDEAQRALAAALRDEQQARRTVADAERRAAGALRDQARAWTGPLSGDDLRARARWSERTAAGRDAARLELDRRRTATDARRGLLAAASRDRQLLDRLHDRRAAEHQEAAARDEQRQADEQALTLHRRRAAA
ncbi:flagellar export protein FliJ [Patulibacter defluvii]|uniref:flagellar export protein FliJ n=1 Tax=Patulibacter defluvii TaxID=3095358 RepID=UPI002A752E19|nr:flagellar export protein FliJ [Patulibacter sp. DM4]